MSEDSLSDLAGCSICKRVNAMTPEQQSTFYTAVTITMLISCILGLIYYLRVRLIPNIPCPPGNLPILGLLFTLTRNLHRFGAWKRQMVDECLENAQKVDEKEARKNGQDPKQVKPREMIQWGMIGAPTFVEVLSPHNMKYFLTDEFDNFIKGYLFADIFGESLGGGIFTVDGESWRQQRKVASHMFSYARLTDYMFETFSSESERVIQYLARVAKSRQEIDFQLLMFEFTFDAICKIAFGKDMHTIGNKVPHSFCRAFDAVQDHCMRRSVTPPFAWKMMRAARFGSEREFSRNLRILDEFIYEIVAERRKCLEEHEESGDLLSLFLNDAKKRGETLTDRHARDLVMNFMIAGRDTTATALTWMFYDFFKMPDIEQKCVDEINTKLDRKVNTTPDAVKSLTTLEATLMESLRTHPPVPVDMKLTLRTCRFPSGEIVPAGTYVAYSPVVVSSLPSWYEQCTVLKHWAHACREFKPERWLVPNDDEENGGGSKEMKILSPPAHEFIVFNVGPRLCLGKSMAVLEAKLLASAILQNFHIKVKPDFVYKERLAPVASMLEGMPCTVEVRRRSK